MDKFSRRDYKRDKKARKWAKRELMKYKYGEYIYVYIWGFGIVLFMVLLTLVYIIIR